MQLFLICIHKIQKRISMKYFSLKMKSLLMVTLFSVLILSCKKKSGQVSNIQSGDYTVTLNSVIDSISIAGISVNGKIPESFPSEFTIAKKVVDIEEEGEKYSQVLFEIIHEGKLSIQIEALENGGSYLANRIVAKCSMFKDGKGIHVGSSLTNFYKAYPRANAYYSYVSEKFWLQNGVDANLQYIFPDDAFRGNRDDLGESDIVELSATDLNTALGITEIILF